MPITRITPADLNGLVDFLRNAQNKFSETTWFSLRLPLQRQPGYREGGDEFIEAGFLKNAEGKIIFYLPTVAAGYNNFGNHAYYGLYLDGELENVCIKIFYPDFINREGEFKLGGESRVLVLDRQMDDRNLYIIGNVVKTLKDFARYAFIPQPHCFNEIQFNGPIGFGLPVYNPNMEWGDPLDHSHSCWPIQNEFAVLTTIQTNNDTSARVALTRAQIDKILSGRFGVNGICDNITSLMKIVVDTDSKIYLAQKGAYLSGVILGRSFNHITNAIENNNFTLAMELLNRGRATERDVLPGLFKLAITNQGNFVFPDQQERFRNSYEGPLRLTRKEKLKFFEAAIKKFPNILNMRNPEFHNSTILGMVLQNGDDGVAELILDEVSPGFESTGEDENGVTDLFYLIASGWDYRVLCSYNYDKIFSLDIDKRENFFDNQGRSALFYLSSFPIHSIPEGMTEDGMRRGIINDVVFNYYKGYFKGDKEEVSEECKRKLFELKYQNHNALEDAIENGHLQIAMSLINEGAKFSEDYLKKTDANNNTALHRISLHRSAQENLVAAAEEASPLIRVTGFMLAHYLNKKDPNPSKIARRREGDEGEDPSSRGRPLAAANSDHLMK